MPTIRNRNGKFQVQVRIRRDGRVVFQDSETFDTKKQAQLWGLNLEKKLGTTGHAAILQERASVAYLLDVHLAMLAELKKPLTAITGRFANLKKAEFAAKPVGKVTTADIIGWAAEFSKTHAAATVLNHLMALSTAFRAGPVAHEITSNVATVAGAISHLKRLGVAATSNERTRRVSEAEADKIAIFHNRQSNTIIPLAPIIRLLIAFPRRREEVMTMLWSDYNEETYTMLLRDTKDPTKVRNEVVPVPPAAQRILATLPRTDDRVLPYKPASVSTAFSRAATMLGIEDITLHDLRHEGISRLFEAGLDIPEVCSISGHLSWNTLKRYTHLKPAQVLEKLNARQ